MNDFSYGFQTDRLNATKRNEYQIPKILEEIQISLNLYLEQNPELEIAEKIFFEEVGVLRRSLIYLSQACDLDEFCESEEVFLNKIDHLDTQVKFETHKKYHTIFLYQEINWLQYDFNNPDEVVRKLGGIEAVAIEYCKSSWMRSDTLEKLILDVTLYCGVVNYATEVLKELPVSSYRRFMHNFIQIYLVRWVIECMFLFLTYLVASIMFSSDQLGLWGTFSLITLIRWLQPRKVNKIKQQSNEHELFYNISDIYLRVGSDSYNPRLIRELIYSCEKKAVLPIFNNSALNVLDLMVQRNRSS